MEQCPKCDGQVLKWGLTMEKGCLQCGWVPKPIIVLDKVKRSQGPVHKRIRL